MSSLRGWGCSCLSFFLEDEWGYFLTALGSLDNGDWSWGGGGGLPPRCKIAHSRLNRSLGNLHPQPLASGPLLDLLGVSHPRTHMGSPGTLAALWAPTSSGSLRPGGSGQPPPPLPLPPAASFFPEPRTPPRGQLRAGALGMRRERNAALRAAAGEPVA